jgi:hypothetical protein
VPLQYPVTAASVGVVYLIGRIIYFTGYSSGAPKNRTMGAAVAGLALLTLVAMCGRMGFVALSAAFKA